MFGNLRIGIPSLITLVFLTSVVSAEVSSGRKYPKITCKQMVYDFGVVNDTESVEHTFMIWNEGNAALQIGKVRACCGMTANIAATNIPPGTNTTLKVKLSLRGRKNEQQKSIYIASNDPDQPHYQLRIQGKVVAAVDIEPRTVYFGHVLPGEVMTQSVDITCQTNFAFRITNIVSTVAQFAAAHESMGNNSHRVTIRTVPTLPYGVKRGMVQIFTDRAGYRQIEIPVIATVSSDILVVPDEILLNEATGKRIPTTRYIALRSRSNKPFRILKVKVPDPDIEVKLSLLGSGGYRCELRNILAFPDLNGETIVITTDHESASEIVIPIRVREE